MRHQEATTTVTAPVAVVERFVADVEHWPSFIEGLDSVRRTGHERYVFCVHGGREHRESVVVVRRDAARHAMTWHSLEGPELSGCIALTAVDGGHTRVRLEQRRHPGTFLAGLAEMVLPRTDRAVHDLTALEEALAGPGR